MAEKKPHNGRHVVITREHFETVLHALTSAGYTLIGPTARDGAIVYDAIDSAAQLPAGWTDEQEAATYRLHHSAGETLFDHTAPSQSWKKLLTPPTAELWRSLKSADGFTFDSPPPVAAPMAFIGVRPCDLAAIAILDKVYLEGSYRDRSYETRRRETFIVAVNCTRAGRTCFCVSLGTGPRAKDHFDLALTELTTSDGHKFVIAIGSQRGARILSDVPHRDATPAELDEVAQHIAVAEAHMGRKLDIHGLKEKFYQARESAHWGKVAERCLACGNCTMVCPTCFCSNVNDTTDPCISCSVRTKTWDSCFTLDFSYIHGGVVRKSIAARYRHWISHKLATWHDQFGTPGCVGCGRCITWCPAQIDITQEAAAVTAPAVSEAAVQS